MSVVRVSVLLPVGPQSPYLSETLQSLKRQTINQWELIIVLDGNVNANREIVDSAGLEVPVVVIEHTTPQGIARSLNAALHRASGDLIARIDADDICYPERFAKQITQFDLDEELMLLGTSANIIGASGELAGKRIVPTQDAVLRRRLIWRNSFIHPSVMFRKNAAILLGGYNIHCTRTEDYELWLRLALCGKVNNLSEPLIGYRVHAGQHTTGRQGISANESKALLKMKLQLAKQGGTPQWFARLIHFIWEWNRTPHNFFPSRTAR